MVVVPVHCHGLLTLFFQVLSLRKKLSAMEAESRLQEQDLAQSLAESRAKEKKLKDDLHHLEMKLQEASRAGESLQMRLSTCEGRSQGLGIELAKAEAAKREVELKLVALHSALRRTLGLGSRSPSPQRSCSPVKGQKAPNQDILHMLCIKFQLSNNCSRHQPLIVVMKYAHS